MAFFGMICAISVEMRTLFAIFGKYNIKSYIELIPGNFIDDFSKKVFQCDFRRNSGNQ